MSDRKYKKSSAMRRMFPILAFVTFLIISFTAPAAKAQQPAIIGATSASNRAVVFPDANIPGTQNLVPGLPAHSHTALLTLVAITG